MRWFSAILEISAKLVLAALNAAQRCLLESSKTVVELSFRDSNPRENLFLYLTCQPRCDYAKYSLPLLFLLSLELPTPKSRIVCRAEIRYLTKKETKARLHTALSVFSDLQRTNGFQRITKFFRWFVSRVSKSLIYANVLFF